MNKLTTGLISLSLLLTAVVPAFATVQEEPKIDQCGEKFTYTKSSDYSDNRVSIDFVNTQSQGNPDTITVSAQVANGYKLVKVELDVENDGQSGYFDRTSNFPGTYNPNPGEDIESAKVTVEKECSGVCNDKEATNFEELKEGSTVADNTLCVYPTPEEPVATPSATPEKGLELPATGTDFWTGVLVFGLGLIAGGLILKYLVRKN